MPKLNLWEVEALGKYLPDNTGGRVKLEGCVLTAHPMTFRACLRRHSQVFVQGTTLLSKTFQGIQGGFKKLLTFRVSLASVSQQRFPGGFVMCQLGQVEPCFPEVPSLQVSGLGGHERLCGRLGGRGEAEGIL